MEPASIVWDYLVMGHHQQLIPSDLILVCCSNDLRVADRAVELYREVIKKQTLTYVVSFILRKKGKKDLSSGKV